MLAFLCLAIAVCFSCANDLVGCGGFVQSEAPVNFSQVEVVLYTSSGVVKYRTDCAPNNGYFLIPLYDKGDFVLRVEPPKGWSFEPESVQLAIDGKTDPCSRGEDINFVFSGFSVNGKILSRGQKEGPAGVRVDISKADGRNTVLNSSTSAEGGSYTFSKLVPGKYVLKASHPMWELDPAVADVTIANGNAIVTRDLIVTGYDMRGQVESDGRAMKGVSLFLFGKAATPIKCKKAKAPAGIENEVTLIGPCLCEAVSDESGSFVFHHLPLGSYQLVPFYQSEHITFDVMPKELKVDVGHSSVEISEPFKVHGFTVSGRVLDSPDGQPVPGAMVIVDGQKKAMTDVKGQYQLEHVVAGTYRIEVSKPHMFFAPESVTISAMTPKLPDLAASSYSVCGKVTATLAGATPLAQRQVRLEGETGKAQTVTCDSKGEFCFQAAAGSWRLSPVITSADRQVGLLLHPAEHPVEVKNSPIRDIIFSQFFASVKVDVVCFSTPCSQLPISLQAVGRSDAKKTILRAQAVDGGARASVTFDQVLPGRYRLTTLHDKWCWKESSVDITVQGESLAPVVFTQTGYLLKYLASHSLKLLYSRKDDGEGSKSKGSPVKGSVDIAAGSGSLCLPQAGSYSLTTKSCHQFVDEPFTYDTHTPSVVSLTASAHRVTGSVMAPATSNEMRILVTGDGKENWVGPLQSTKVQDEDGQPQHVYHFTYWAKPGKTLTIEPRLPDMLFKPQSQHVTVPTETCPERIPVFHGRRGVYVEGQVTTATGGSARRWSTSAERKRS